MSKSLLDKVWEQHEVARLASGQSQLFIGLHLIHEVTSPQAFDMLSELGLEVAFRDRTFATVDHIIPTDGAARPYADTMAEEMFQAIERNVAKTGITFFDEASGAQGIVHVIGPELGISQPGMTIACGDSHTSTHGALGAVAFGIGTSQVRDILATQTMAVSKPKLRRIEVSGSLGRGVYPKDVILNIIGRLGVQGGTGYAYEYGGAVFDDMSMEGRMTVCNMSIEGGARVGYVNPDQTTFEYLRGRRYTPRGADFERAVRWWSQQASEPDAEYDDVVHFDGSAIEPMVTWGTNPGQVVGVGQAVPDPRSVHPVESGAVAAALEFMGFAPEQPIAGFPIDVAFIGSCTNSRISDLREAAAVVRGNRVEGSVKAIVVPGSQQVRAQAESEGLHEVFLDAGFEWRDAGCSMCLGMNPDKLEGRQVSASSSNRNFIGRQGSPTGRTLLMSPAMVAAAALAGSVADVREVAR